MLKEDQRQMEVIQAAVAANPSEKNKARLAHHAMRLQKVEAWHALLTAQQGGAAAYKRRRRRAASLIPGTYRGARVGVER